MKIKILLCFYLVICSINVEAKQHRSYKAKVEFKQTHPCPANGNTKGMCPGYIIDHVIALKRGGEDEPSNMQWQTIDDAKQKDLWE